MRLLFACIDICPGGFFISIVSTIITWVGLNSSIELRKFSGVSPASIIFIFSDFMSGLSFSAIITPAASSLLNLFPIPMTTILSAFSSSLVNCFFMSMIK